MREGHVGGRQQVHLLPVWNKGLLFSIFIDSCILSQYNLRQTIIILLVKLSLKYSLLGASGKESLFQVAARHPGLQHDALQLQHGHHDEGEGQHALQLPFPLGHDALHGADPDTKQEQGGDCEDRVPGI